MSPSRQEWRRYLEAEGRFKESIKERRAGDPNHTYPRLEGDLRTLRHFHDQYGGIPERGLRAWFRRWLGWLTPRGGGA